MTAFAERAYRLQQEFINKGGFKPFHDIAGAMPLGGAKEHHFGRALKLAEDFRDSAHFRLSDVITYNGARDPNQRMMVAQVGYMMPMPDHGHDAYAPATTLMLLTRYCAGLLQRRLPVLFSNMDYLQERHLQETDGVIQFKSKEIDHSLSLAMSLAQVLPEKWGTTPPAYEPVALPYSDGLFVGTAHPVAADEFTYLPGSFMARAQLTKGRQTRFDRRNNPPTDVLPRAAIVIRNFVSHERMTQNERAIHDELFPAFHDLAVNDGPELVQHYDYIYGSNMPDYRYMVAYVGEADPTLTPDQAQAKMREYDSRLAVQEHRLADTIRGHNWELFGDEARPFIDRHSIHYRKRGAVTDSHPVARGETVQPSIVQPSGVANNLTLG